MSLRNRLLFRLRFLLFGLSQILQHWSRRLYIASLVYSGKIKELKEYFSDSNHVVIIYIERNTQQYKIAGIITENVAEYEKELNRIKTMFGPVQFAMSIDVLRTLIEKNQYERELYYYELSKRIDYAGGHYVH